MKLNRNPEQWAAIVPDAFLTGSIVQARNVIEMLQQDIASLAAELETVQNHRARVGRNRDMWKAQVERQAAALSKNCSVPPADGAKP